MHPVTEKIKESNRIHHLFERGAPVLVGVSGGPDSMTLLHNLITLRQEWGIRLHIAHVNHGLRPASGREQNFVRAFAEKRSIPFHTTNLKIVRRKDRSSIEDLAREERLKFFLKISRKHHIKTLALGHNQDDLAETVLMRILRGAGLQGLQSILPKRKMHGLSVVRPLISVTRREIMLYLQKNKIAYRRDQSNFTTQYLRNKVRLKLIPVLEKYNPNIKKTLANLAINAGIDYSFLDTISRKHFKRCATLNSRSVKLKLTELLKLQKSIQRIVLRQAVESINAGPTPLTTDHIEAIEDMFSNPSRHAVITLAGNKLKVTHKGPDIIISR